MAASPTSCSDLKGPFYRHDYFANEIKYGETLYYAEIPVRIFF